MKQGLLFGGMIATVILLVLSVFVHLITFFGFNPQAEFPAVWLLHVGIFLVFIPLFIMYAKEPGGRFGVIDHSQVMKYAPCWMRVLVTAFAVYAVINFGLGFVLSDGGTPDIWDGRYVLQSHGQLIREITFDEYERQNAYLVRTFSGHWMLFYFYPIVAYYSYLNKDEEDEVEQA